MEVEGLSQEWSGSGRLSRRETEIRSLRFPWIIKESSGQSPAIVFLQALGITALDSVHTWIIVDYNSNVVRDSL